jgi:hypothetical protein
MILVDDYATATMEWHVAEAVRLIETVRSEATQAFIMPFLKHLCGVVNEANEAMSAAVVCLNNIGTLDNQTFAKVYATGSTHGAMVMFCRALVNDLSDHVRLAGATGEIVLSQMETTLDHVRVIKVVQERLNMKS